MGSKAYNGLRFFALVVLPAISALYFGFGQIWHFPFIAEVVGSIAILDTVLGTALNKVSEDYFKRANVADVFVGLDEDGAAEIRRVEQTSDDLLIFKEGDPVLMQVRHERD
jgi:hypothetical protein